MSSKPDFSVGDSVRFNNGEIDEDFGVDMGGWQGRIKQVDVDNQMILVAFDSITLRQTPIKYIEECEEQGLNWAEYNIEWDSVEKVERRDTVQDVRATIRELAIKVQWSFLGEEGKEMNKIIGDAGNEQEQYAAWKNHILSTVKFPLKVKVAEWQRPSSPYQVGDRVKIVDIDFIDDTYGLIASLKDGGALPLADLKVVPKRSRYHDTIQLYAVWFANR
ncbi:MAG: calcium-binding protein [Chloroflexota bacterium]